MQGKRILLWTQSRAEPHHRTTEPNVRTMASPESSRKQHDADGLRALMRRSLGCGCLGPGCPALGPLLALELDVRHQISICNCANVLTTPLGKLA